MTQVIEAPLEQAGAKEYTPFSLESITSSRDFPAQKVVVYGVPGVGKTTFASTWPRPILIRTEDGASALDIPTFPKIVANMKDLGDAIRALLNGDHDFKTVVLDSLDWTEPFVWDNVCRAECKQSIEDFGFGKGYVKVDTVWRQIQQSLELLRTKKHMHILAIAHAVPQIFDPPDNDSFMRYNIKLHKRAASLWTEWSDMLLFVNYKVDKVEASANGRGKAIGTGARTIFTQEQPAWLAKSRWPLPPEIFVGNDIHWSAFHDALKTASEGAYA